MKERTIETLAAAEKEIRSMAAQIISPAKGRERFEAYAAAIREAIRQLTPGYVCAGCFIAQSPDKYFYTAINVETKQVLTPLCARCVRGELLTVIGPPWRHQGPFTQ